jgi:hypothetical protein
MRIPKWERQPFFARASSTAAEPAVKDNARLRFTNFCPETIQ